MLQLLWLLSASTCLPLDSHPTPQTKTLLSLNPAGVDWAQVSHFASHEKKLVRFMHGPQGKPHGKGRGLAWWQRGWVAAILAWATCCCTPQVDLTRTPERREEMLAASTERIIPQVHVNGKVRR